MRVTKAVSGFSIVNTQAIAFFELKIIAPYFERGSLEKLAKKIELFIEENEKEADKNGK
jgi:hypothetical protein